MIYSQAAAAHIYIGVAIILAILVTSILGVALSIILNLRSDQHEQKVCLDCGHGGSDPGAVNDPREEKTDVLKIGLKVRDLLTAQGINVVLTRASDKKLRLTTGAKSPIPRSVITF